MTVTSKSQDWRPKRIIAALHAKQITLAGLSKRAGYEQSAAAVALGRPWPAVERVIARAIGMKPSLIWPSRYDADDSPRTGHNLTTGSNAVHVERPGASTQ